MATPSRNLLNYHRINREPRTHSPGAESKCQALGREALRPPAHLQAASPRGAQRLTSRAPSPRLHSRERVTQPDRLTAGLRVSELPWMGHTGHTAGHRPSRLWSQQVWGGPRTGLSDICPGAAASEGPERPCALPVGAAAPPCALWAWVCIVGGPLAFQPLLGREKPNQVKSLGLTTTLTLPKTCASHRKTSAARFHIHEAKTGRFPGSRRGTRALGGRSRRPTVEFRSGTVRKLEFCGNIVPVAKCSGLYTQTFGS